jgi:hypothetical protein
VFVIGMTSVRNWFHVALLVGGKQRTTCQNHPTDAFCLLKQGQDIAAVVACEIPLKDQGFSCCISSSSSNQKTTGSCTFKSFRDKNAFDHRAVTKVASVVGNLNWPPFFVTLDQLDTGDSDCCKINEIFITEAREQAGPI